MKVYVTKITKQQLLNIPETERVLFLQFGHTCNELTFFNKLLMFVSDPNTHGVENKGMVVQSMIVARVYIGKVFETWRMLENDLFSTNLMPDLITNLPEEAKISLDNLKQYFGRNNLLSTIRNKFSFHYLSDHINETLESFDDNKEFTLILGKAYANTVHHFAEEIVSVAMLEKTKKPTAKEAMDILIGDLVNVGGEMINFLGQALTTIFIMRVGQDWHEFEWKDYEITSEVKLNEFTIPYFINESTHNA